MSRVLFAWELGSGMGHVTRLLPLADALHEHGVEPVFAVKMLVETSTALDGRGWPVLQAPVWHSRRPPGQTFLAATYADVLAVHGYDHPDHLKAMLGAWRELLDRVKPELLVCDHAPTAALAAFDDLPVVLVGNGFSVPPTNGDWFPRMEARELPTVDQGAVLSVIKLVQDRLGRSKPETITAFLNRASRFVCTFSELDPYASIRREPAVGPYRLLPAPSTSADGDGFFAYMDAHYPGLETGLAALAGSGKRGTAYIRSGDAAQKERLRSAGIDVYNEPAPLAEELPKRAVVLHHASLGVAEATLAARRPSLTFPRHLEQRLTGDALVRLGVGRSLTGKLSVDDVLREYRELTEDSQAANRAKSISRKIAENHHPQKVLAAIVEECLRSTSFSA